jgi:hypothetical protein
MGLPVKQDKVKWTFGKQAVPSLRKGRRNFIGEVGLPATDPGTGGCLESGQLQYNPTRAGG